MSTILVDCPAALVAQPRPRVALGRLATGARLHADDAQPRLHGSSMTAATAWRRDAGFEMRGQEFAGQITKAGRDADFGGVYVTTTKQHSTRSGPPTSRPPA